MAWGFFMTIYSFALVCLGAAFTFFLNHYATKHGSHRLLAGGDDDGGDMERERSALLFCVSLAVIFLCLDGMTVLHIGLDDISSRLRSHGKRNVKGITVLVLRLAIIPFTATLSVWETDPGRLSMIALLCVLAQLVLRKFGNMFLSPQVEPEPAAGDEQATPTAATSPRRFRESVLMASALVNMSERQLAGLEAEASEELE